jgi:hypothetical protein
LQLVLKKTLRIRRWKVQNSKVKEIVRILVRNYKFLITSSKLQVGNYKCEIFWSICRSLNFKRWSGMLRPLGKFVKTYSIVVIINWPNQQKLFMLSE